MYLHGYLGGSLWGGTGNGQPPVDTTDAALGQKLGQHAAQGLVADPEALTEGRSGARLVDGGQKVIHLVA